MAPIRCPAPQSANVSCNTAVAQKSSVCDDRASPDWVISDGEVKVKMIWTKNVGFCCRI